MSYAIMGMDGCYVIFLILFIVSYNCKHGSRSSRTKSDDSSELHETLERDPEQKFLVAKGEDEI
jgi:hypothetical protein